MNFKNIVEIDANAIKVSETRVRDDMGEIEGLAKSITKFGQFVPIVLNGDDLVAGERRVLACRALNIPVKAIQEHDMTEEFRLGIELEENIRRKNFTVEEEIKGKAKLHELRMKTEKGWNIRKTAEELGESHGQVGMDVEAAKLMEANPDLFKGVTKKTQAYAVVRKEKEKEIIAEINKRAESKDYGHKATNLVFNGDCVTLMRSLPDSIYDAVISDPPFGINISKVKKQDVKKEIYDENVDDTADGYKQMMSDALDEMVRITRPDSWIVLFCGIEYFYWLHGELTKRGVKCDVVPAIWYKSNSGGQTMQPATMFGKVYEAIIYGYKGDAVLLKQGQPNVLAFEPVPPTLKTHPLERPLPLMKELIERFCIKGNRIIDPFCGSASTLVAALELGVVPTGIELNEDKYQQAIKNVADFFIRLDTGAL